ncbi:MAG: chromate resistance protein ChrB domain-containing protein [Burkholderiales bacterium]
MEIAVTPDRWLMLVLTLQGQQGALRMRIWRALKALGTAVVRDGVYLLPNRPELSAALREIEKDVANSGGTVQLLEVDTRDDKQQRDFERLFDRTDEYRKFLDDVHNAGKKIKDLSAGALASTVERLRRDFEAISAVDFFPAGARDQALHALEDLIARSNAILSPGEPHAVDGRVRQLRVEDFHGRVWATRKRPWADRLASAWLIRRFIDSRARFVWLEKPEDCPTDALGFDFDGATFTHVGGKVTFEVLATSFGLDADSAVEKIGALIHYLDVGGVPIAEAPGFEALLRGAYAKIGGDDALLREIEKLLDFLYDGYTRQH